MKIIVSRYTDCVDWTKQFPNVIIYNKGYTLNNYNNEVLLDNVGREGHTYYKYICDNYDNLEDYTIFLQGRPFDHSPNIIFNLNKYINDKDISIDFEITRIINKFRYILYSKIRRNCYRSTIYFKV